MWPCALLLRTVYYYYCRVGLPIKAEKVVGVEWLCLLDIYVSARGVTTPMASWPCALPIDLPAPMVASDLGSIIIDLMQEVCCSF